MKSRQEPPEAIIVTLPRRFFVEQDHAAYLREIAQMNLNPEMIWYRVCKNLPIYDVLYVYTIIDNKIHHRSQFCGLLRNQTMRFSRPGGKYRTFENANAVMMCGPVIMAPHEIVMRGFQGFRYSKILF